MTNSLQIAHAGSLIGLLQESIIPGFVRQSAAAIAIDCHPGPAVGLANQIRARAIVPDLYLSADAETNQLLMGAPPDNLVEWFLGFARNRMVLAYSPFSRFRTELEAAAAGARPWYEVLQLPGFVLRRSDPRVDPGGYRTVFVMQLAEEFYGEPGLREQILQGDDNESHFRVCPEIK